MKKLIALLLTCTAYLAAVAQPDSMVAVTPTGKKNWDAGIVNTLKQGGGIYAVIVVIIIIIAGLFWYMMRLDKKLDRLEQQIKN